MDQVSRAAPYPRLRGESMAEDQRKFPLSAKPQMEDLPMEILVGDARLTQSAAKDKILWWAHSLPFSWENTGLELSWWKGFMAA